jgi:uncharacterized membrane protein
MGQTRGFLSLPAAPPSGVGWAKVSMIAAAAVVPAQIAYPLLSGTALTAVTVVTVVLFAGAVIAQAAACCGPATAVRLLLVTGGVSLVAETIGLRTGYPFGAYTYETLPGARIGDVPLVVLLAWTMMAYPALLVARRLAAPVTSRVPATSRTATISRALVAAVGGVTLAAWDLFLDPQLVAAGFWTWRYPEFGLPGVPGVPLTNLVGWLLVGTALTAILDRLLPAVPASVPASDRTASEVHAPPSGLAAVPLSATVPAALLAWTWLGSTLANLAFFDRAALAGYGFVALGSTVAPYLFLHLRDLRPHLRDLRLLRRERGAR